MRRSSLLAAAGSVLRRVGVPSEGEGVVVGLSGGPDSVAMLDALVTLGRERGFRVVAAHLDHGLRTHSAEDVSFCRELCERLQVPLHAGRADVAGRAASDHTGIEEAGRLERYRFLREVKDGEQARFVAVAHTRDDQAETVLLRLLRGASTSGLSAMRTVSGDLLRPLLKVSRKCVMEHLEARGLKFLSDETNEDRSLLRNRVRHELLPFLEERFNPRIREGLCRTAELLASDRDFLEAEAQKLLDSVGRSEEGGVSLDREGLVRAPRAVARHALRSALQRVGGLRGVSALHVERVLDVAGSVAPSGRKVELGGGTRAIFRFDRLFLVGPPAPQARFFAELSVPGSVELPSGAFVLARPDPGPPASSETEAVIPEPSTPLVVRTRLRGDRVLSGGREKSLSRFLMEERVPADLRSGLPLVATGHRVVFIPGAVLDRFQAPSESFVRLQVQRA